MKDTMDNWVQEKKDITDKLKQIISLILDDNLTIRQVADNMSIQKSTVHRYIHNYIKRDYPDDYEKLQGVLLYNQKKRCVPRKYWKKQ